MSEELYDDWLEEDPSRHGTSVLETFGNKMFIDGLRGSGLEYMSLNAKEHTDMRLVGMPTSFALARGIVTQQYADMIGEGVLPFLVTRKRNHTITDPVDTLYTFRSAWKLRVVRYFGPDGEEGDRSPAAAKLHWIDDWSPHMRKQFRKEGRPPPKMFASVVMARAPSVSRGQARFHDFYNEDAFYSPVKEGQLMLFTIGLCTNHGRVECSPDNPCASLFLLNFSAMRSLEELCYATREGYHFPDNCTLEALDTYQELSRRFMNPDLVHPKGAPMLRITYHKQKASRKEASGEKRRGGNFQGNRYECTLLNRPNTNQVALFGCPVDRQEHIWVPPEKIFNFMTPQEQRDFVLERASNYDWADFIIECLKGTDLAPSEVVQGTSAERAQQAKAAENARIREAIDTFDTSDDDGSDVVDMLGDAVVESGGALQPAEPGQTQQPAQQQAAEFAEAQQLNLSGFEVSGAEREQKLLNQGPPPKAEQGQEQMRLPEVDQVYQEPQTVADYDAAENAPTDHPDNVGQQQRSAEERLNNLMGRQG